MSKRIAHNKYPQEVINKFIELYSSKTSSLTKLAKETGYDRETITKWLKDSDIELKVKKFGKLGINSNIFNVIDSEEKAYWLGFLYADGSIHKNKEGSFVIQLCLKEDDLKHIEKFKAFLSANNPIKYRKRVKAYRISFTDQIIANDLIKLGCTPKKSLILKFPTEEQVPKHLLQHFIRGYFDGDGCINNLNYTTALSLLGTENILKGILENLKIMKEIKVKKNVKNNPLVCLFALSGNNARDFLSLLYKNANIYLERKYELYLGHKQKIDKRCLRYGIIKKLQWSLE